MIWKWNIVQWYYEMANQWRPDKWRYEAICERETNDMKQYIEKKWWNENSNGKLWYDENIIMTINVMWNYINEKVMSLLVFVKVKKMKMNNDILFNEMTNTNIMKKNENAINNNNVMKRRMRKSKWKWKYMKYETNYIKWRNIWKWYMKNNIVKRY